MNGQDKGRRSGLLIMGRLIGLVRPLLPLMVLAVILGVCGYLCAIFVTVTAGYALLKAAAEIPGAGDSFSLSFLLSFKPSSIFILMAVLAVFRGILHYGEQYCNHFIAFKLLAIIRHKVFAKLRVLSPVKLEGKDKGDLLSVITTDIELLEVFYAHTISPICIAAATSVIMLVFFAGIYLPAMLLALFGYIVVGIIIPLVNGRAGAEEGIRFRRAFGDLNSLILDSLRGIDETIQYGGGDERLRKIRDGSNRLGSMQENLSRMEGRQKAVTNLAILAFSAAMLIVCTPVSAGGGGFGIPLISTIAMMSSFGPVVALSNLSNNLTQTLAAGERVLSLLEEKPRVEEVCGMERTEFSGAELLDVSFSYDDSSDDTASDEMREAVLKDFSVKIPGGKVTGIHGQSGSGKSTILKLLMRFWDTDFGKVLISEKDIKKVNTADLRDMQSYVTQDTYIFKDTLAENIALGRSGASAEEIEAAAKKASVHEFIMSLPEGYQTRAGELGSTLSGGERQRIGMARAFLHDAPMMLLDEPTSNLDSLNEGIILKSLKEFAGEKTIVMVSHRDSTMSLADEVIEMSGERKS